MSIAASNAVWQRSGADGLRLLLMLALADEVRGESVDTCWPSVNTIARKIRRTPRQVRRLIRELVDAGELACHEGAGRVKTRTGVKVTNRYRLCPGGEAIIPRTPDIAMSGVLVHGNGPNPGHAKPNPGHSERNPGHFDTGTPDIAMSSEPVVNRESEPVENRKSRPVGLTGHRIDYQTAELPDIGDYADIHNCPDPILAAMAVTGEWSKQSWGHWVKVLNRARKKLGSDRAKRLFRRCLDELYGEMKAGECDKPGAVLNLKLDKVFGPSA